METEMKKAVAAAELIPLLDVKNEEDVKTIAEATEAPIEVVEAVAAASEELDQKAQENEVVTEEVISNFSKKVNEIIHNHKYVKNFSEAQKTEKEKLLNAMELVELIDKDNLTKETACMAECIADATGADKEVVGAAVEIAKNFAKAGKELPSFTFKAKNFADASETGAKENIVIEKEETEPVVAEKKPEATLTEGDAPEAKEGNVTQEKKDAELDVKEGDKPSNPTPAVEGMKVSEKMATVETKIDAVDNFSKKEGKTSLLGSYLKNLS